MSLVSRCLPFLGAIVASFVVYAALTPAHANSKYAAYVVHADSGDVLFSRYSNARRYPASLTKVMTLYILFEKLERGEYTLDTKLKVSTRSAGQPPSKLGLKPGSTITVREAIGALIVKSANDVAATVAENVSGSEWRFARLMTSKARSLGMARTTFRNASGLPNSRQITTARDMSILARRVMQDFPQYFPMFEMKSFSYNGRTYSTHNGLLKTLNGVNGIKTGYTRRSGFNLITSIDRDGDKLIGVVLGGRSSRSRNAHMQKIINEAYAQIKRNPLKIAALHRDTPEPRLKPTLIAQNPVLGAPTLAGNEELQIEIASVASQIMMSSTDDAMGELIAAADSDDLNAGEYARLGAVTAQDGFVGEGDRESLNELNWIVQIGAYSTKSLAQKELEEAARRADLTDRDRIVAPSIRSDGSTLYRARFQKLTEIDAALMCDALKAKEIACFVREIE